MLPRPNKIMVSCAVLVMASLFPSPAVSQQLVRDINRQVQGLYGPKNLTKLGDAYVFSHRAQLWRSDGSESGTRFVKTIKVDGDSRFARSLDQFTVINSQVFFRVLEDVTKANVWVSDGTVGGTYALTSFSGVDIGDMVVLGSHLFFLTIGSNTSRLWMSDGTPAGTRRVKNGQINLFSFVNKPVVARDSLFFEVSDRNMGRQLWKIDEFAQSFDIVDVDQSHPLFFTDIADSFFYFTGNDVSHGAEPWVSDGTRKGTHLLKDINPGPAGSYSRYVTDLDGKALFQTSDETRSTELWISDGTTEGTTSLHDISDGFNTFADVWGMLGNRLFFTASDAEHGSEVWVTDGTSDGTFMVRDINPGFAGSNPEAYGFAGEIMYFCASDGQLGFELWRTDGTTRGTWLVSDINRGGGSSFPGFVVPFESGFLLSAGDALNGGALWTSDGTGSGTRMVKDIDRSRGTMSSRPSDLINFDGQIFFSADDGIAGWELWATRGSRGTTRLFADFFEGSDSSYPSTVSVTNNRLIVSVFGQPWSLEPGAHEFQRLTNPPEGRPPNNGTGGVVAMDDMIAFQATDSEFGPQLWMSDGTLAGTRRLTEFAGTTSGYWSFDPMGRIDGRILFSLFHEGVYDIYSNAGHPGTTILLQKDIKDKPHASRTVGGKVLIAGPGRDLFATDGTSEGTELLRYFDGRYPGIGPFISLGDRVFFSAKDNFNKTAGVELWSSDGTKSGTKNVRNINPGSASSNPNHYIVAGDRLYFAAVDGVHGQELWVTDGTSVGTTLVLDIAPGSASSLPRPLAYTDGVLYFSAITESTGRELWITDGTAGGTSLVSDFFSGPQGSYPSSAVVMNGELYLSQTHPVYGTELFKYDLSTIHVDTEAAGPIPREFALSANYPNPFNPSTTIEFSVARTTDLELSIHDLLGKEIRVLVHDTYPPGRFEYSFDASSLASGVYFYTLKTPDFVRTRKMLLVK